ncbi:MAG: RHS repeat-associated core domain-containing protein, partial [Caldilineaceae bacterium]|nr:RHS repeat-associated core domain-containing protein [Caldilineaceae bacterium]
MLTFEGATATYGNTSHKHAVSKVGSKLYSYDLNGNMTSRGTGSGTQTLAWNNENRLQSVNGAGAAESYGYDPDGRRVKVVAGNTTTFFINPYYEVEVTTLSGIISAAVESVDGTVPVTATNGATTTGVITATAMEVPSATPTEIPMASPTPSPAATPTATPQPADVAAVRSVYLPAVNNAQAAGNAANAAAGAQIYLPSVSRSDVTGEAAPAAEAAAEAVPESESVTPGEQPDAITAATVVIRKYYYFGGQRAAMREGSTLRYLHWNHLGSTVMETSAAGSVLTDQKYYPFGAQRDAGPVVTDHRFTGQKQDESGLYYYNARYYDPEIGHFISPDTLVPDPMRVDAYNRYMYS